MRPFTLVWLALVVSTTGSQMTGFALGIWLFARTGQTTWYGLVALATIAPTVLAAPLAGVLVDRWDRRRALIAGQLGAGACSLLTLAVLTRGDPPPALLLAPVLLGAICRSVEFPALAAVTTALVPPTAIGRANGLVQLGAAGAQIAAPATAAALMPALGVRGVVWIDLASFAVATALLGAVRMPRHGAAPAAGSVGADLRAAWRFLVERPGLGGLLVLFAAANLTLGMLQVRAAPVVLGFGTAATLGLISSAAGVGMLAGGLVGTVWGGPSRRVRGVLALCAVQGLMFLVAAARPSPWLVGVGAVGVLFTIPLIVQSASTIWQHKVPSELQGRVFALRALLAGSALPVGYLAAGPLADRLFEPLLRGGGHLAGSVGRILGTGPGRGAALLLVILGATTILAALVAGASPRLRRVEEELPDLGIPQAPRS